MINETDKCVGKWTRINSKNKEEKSILDYVITTKEVYQQTENMIIDEQELLKLSGSKPSDHNTILLEINIPKIRSTTKKKEIWKINKNTKWAEYRKELEQELHQSSSSFQGNTNVQKQYEYIIKAILKSVENIIGRTKIPSKPKNMHLNKARERRNLLEKEYNRAIQSNIPQLILETKEKYIESQKI